MEGDLRPPLADLLPLSAGANAMSYTPMPGTDAFPPSLEQQHPSIMQPHPSIPPQSAEAAARAAQIVAARLYVKQSTANRIAQVKLAKQIPLPSFLEELLIILNQFDQSNFGVLWFSTNFTMFYHEYCLHLVSPDKSRPIGLRTFNPIFQEINPKELETLYSNWLETFNNITSINQTNLIEMLKSERSAMHLNLFRKAYEAIWSRDFQVTLEEVDLDHILRHLHALFVAAAAPDQDPVKIVASESYTIIRHIIVTFVHMASKDYEMITRSLH